MCHTGDSSRFPRRYEGRTPTHAHTSNFPYKSIFIVLMYPASARCLHPGYSFMWPTCFLLDFVSRENNSRSVRGWSRLFRFQTIQLIPDGITSAFKLHRQGIFCFIFFYFNFKFHWILEGFFFSWETNSAPSPSAPLPVDTLYLHQYYLSCRPEPGTNTQVSRRRVTIWCGLTDEGGGKTAISGTFAALTERFRQKCSDLGQCFFSVSSFQGKFKWIHSEGCGF